MKPRRLRLANDSQFGLAAAVMSADPARCQRVSRGLRAGIVWVNCSQPTFTQAPWGGYKQSGIGRELGVWGLDNYLETKQVTEYLSDSLGAGTSSKLKLPAQRRAFAYERTSSAIDTRRLWAGR